MKKLLTILAGITLALPAFASAASFVVTPDASSYSAGDTITLNISVDPEGTSVYAAMLDAHFSTSTLEVSSFTMNDKVLALKQPGYDLVDNTSGTLTKTGGYPGGIATTTPFATLVLHAKQGGTATFTVADASLLFDSKNNDQQHGDKTTTLTIAGTIAKTPVAASVTTATTTATSPTAVSGTTSASVPTSSTNNGAATVATTANDTPTATTGGTETSSVSTSPIRTQLAAVIAATKGNSLLVGSLMLLITIMWSGYVLHRKNLLVRVVNKFRK